MNEKDVPKLCDSPRNISITPRLLSLKGDTFEVKCASPGYPASREAAVVFYWDRGPEYGEYVDIRGYKPSTEPAASLQCSRYGITPLKME